ncbi:hypothetical protein HYC85_005132 [Camellia sinensis]|uniref:Uncharacterized protein n=1 Tax=Camellia sinensis TaxID=4442 RepID=A0A7J7HZT8_CAMSI|nr:hypothetical protein HYC85_005132 [Camellia sinensis]
MCPMVSHNITLETLPLSYSKLDLNLKCLRSDANQSYVFKVGNEPEGIDWYDYCEEKVVATVMESDIDEINDLISGFGGARNDGRWRIAACVRHPKGVVGYNEVAKAFLFFCSDGSIGNDHCKGT